MILYNTSSDTSGSIDSIDSIDSISSIENSERSDIKKKIRLTKLVMKINCHEKNSDEKEKNSLKIMATAECSE